MFTHKHTQTHTCSNDDCILLHVHLEAFPLPLCVRGSIPIYNVPPSISYGQPPSWCGCRMTGRGSDLNVDCDCMGVVWGLTDWVVSNVLLDTSRKQVFRAIDSMALVASTRVALAVDNAASEQLHSKWPPIVYAEVKCHFTAEIIHVWNSSSSFGDIILHILNFPQLRPICFATTYSLSTYVHRPTQMH